MDGKNSEDLAVKTTIQTNIDLPAVLDITAAGPLASDILLNRGKDVTVDASRVERMGAQCLQVLLSAVATWSHDGMEFEVTGPSPEFVEALETAGLGMDHLSARNS
jgi:chemotaxis protein CheX